MQTWADILHFLDCWRGLDASWSRIEVGLVGWDLVWVLRSKSVETLPNFPQHDSNLYPPRNSGSNTAQYLNVRQRKLSTIIIQTVCILHEIAVTDSLPAREFVHGQPNLLPINLALGCNTVTPLYRLYMGKIQCALCTVVSYLKEEVAWFLHYTRPDKMYGNI